MEPTKNTDTFLDDLFEDAKTAEPSEDFFAKMMVDMEANVPTPKPTAAPESEGSIWQLFGGWTTWSSLATALVVGVIVGYNPPEAVWDATDTFFAAELLEVDMFDDDLTDILEGTL